MGLLEIRILLNCGGILKSWYQQPNYSDISAKLFVTDGQVVPRNYSFYYWLQSKLITIFGLLLQLLITKPAHKLCISEFLPLNKGASECTRIAHLTSKNSAPLTFEMIISLCLSNGVRLGGILMFFNLYLDELSVEPTPNFHQICKRCLTYVTCKLIAHH